ncbi:MAG: prephenate dehydratase domain-containing protein [Candidatus Methanomethylophilaceae archaeon]
MAIKIGYMGLPFSNSEEAALEFAKSNNWTDYELLPLISSKDVVLSLENKESDFGVVASNNIGAGPVIETELALKGKDNIELLQTSIVHIHHCVFVRKKDVVIQTLASHVQALLQTKNTLKKLYPNTDRLEVEDTALAAKMLSEGLLPDSCAVICKKDAGEFYDLILEHENVEDRKDNLTTFTLLKMRKV